MTSMGSLLFWLECCALTGALLFYVLNWTLFYDIVTMIRIPGTKLHLRAFDRVETSDSQYDIVDFGIQHEDGGIDSLVVGGSFYSLKKAVANLNDNADKKAEEPAAA